MVDPLRVVEMMPVRVVDIVPLRLVPAAVVEMVPVLVVEIVPVLVVEMVPDFANVGADIARTNIVDHMTNLMFFILLLLVTRTSGVIWSVRRFRPLSHSFGPTLTNN